MKKILFYIDQNKRDFYHSYMIGKYLSKKYEYSIDFCSHLDAVFKFILFRPDIVMIGNPDIYHGLVSNFFSKFAKIVSMPTEQAMFDEKDFIRRIFPRYCFFPD
jgi:hypothetical protein